MAKNKKPLLQEGTVRRMMKLANMDSLGDGFITEKWSGAKFGEKDYTTKKDDELKDDESGGRGEKKGDKAYVNEQEEEMDFEAEEEVEAEAPVEEPAEEGSVEITDEEAQDIIDLADKLKDAVGGGEEVEAEEEVEMEGPGGEMEMGAEEEVIDEPGNRGMYEEQDDLYEAALKGLNVTLVDDKAAQAQALLQEVKGRIYKRVVNRLLKENNKPAPRRRRKRR